jgi:hypothetical protein
VAVSGLRCGPRNFIKKSSSWCRVCESFLRVKYLTTSSLSLSHFSFLCCLFILVALLPVLTLDLHGIDFSFFLLSLVYLGWRPG